MKDFWGNEIPDKEPDKLKSHYQRIKAINNYRKSSSHEINCKNCGHRKTFEYHNRYYHKCKLIGESSSEATDIRLSCVCNKYEED